MVDFSGQGKDEKVISKKSTKKSIPKKRSPSGNTGSNLNISSPKIDLSYVSFDDRLKILEEKMRNSVNLTKDQKVGLEKILEAYIKQQKNKSKSNQKQARSLWETLGLEGKCP